ncbi:MAG: ABC transporter permease [Lachnospiraceae bacterium]|nr:ABC transporter permease [Lachnospiraceae bacterium]
MFKKNSIFWYILKRIALMFFVLFAILVMCFVLVKLLPVTDADAFGKDKNLILARREALGYNKPILVQFGIFLKRSILGGDWGISETLYRNQEVWAVFISKLPATLLVNVYSMLFSVPLGLALGIYAALKKNKWQDYLISTLVMVFISVPSYVYAFLVQYIFCFRLQWFPLQMKSGTDWLSWPMFVSVVPAVISLGFGTVAGLARYSRAELSEVLTSDFMLLARTKGLKRSQATLRHALRNSMVPVFPMILGEFVGILGGSLIIEQIFGVPGVGQLFLNSITALDYNFFMLLTAFYTLIGLVAGIVVDISYGLIDPRIKMGQR